MGRFKWRHQYDEKADAEARECSASCPEGESLTQQHHMEDADLNVLVRRFGVETAAVPPMAQDARYYGDVSDVPDLRAVMEIAREAKDRFMQLDPRLRARFHNDPRLLHEFVTDPENGPECVRLGLLVDPAAVVEPEVKLTVPVVPVAPEGAK